MRKLVSISLLIFAAAMVVLAFVANGTGDEGDSVFHYLFSRFAFEHPENFLNHWAKPVFVLFTAPIAQGGFIAMKLFNIALLIATIWLTWKSSLKLNIPNAWLVIFPIMFAPMNISHTLSGLTEPMFAFWLMVGIYLFLSEKNVSAVLWLSFLPFVRSEGLIVFCVVILYLLIKRHWKLLPLLAVGHIVYSLIGFFHYGDFLWVFNKMTYATLNGSYGSGPLWHFADNMHVVIGDLQPVLLIFGVLVGGIRLLQYWLGKAPFSKDELWLVYGIAIAYFIAHSLYWYLGIFNSFGLMRVMIGVIPLFAIIIVQGLNYLISLLSENAQTRFRNPLLFSMAGLMLVFLFLKLDYQRDLELKPIQRGQKQLQEKYGERYKGYTHHFDAIYPAVVFDTDWFDAMSHRENGQLFSGEPIPSKSIAIWDSWFSVQEGKIPLSKFEEDPRFKLIECVNIEENGNKKTCLFEFDSTFANAQILLKTGFEEEADLTFSDSTKVKSGKFSKILGKKKAFSKSFTGWINSFLHVPNPTVKMTCWAYLPKGIEKREHGARGVISFESALKSFDYHADPIFAPDAQPGEWHFVEMERPIPNYKMIKDKVKVYIWNPDQTEILIDDLEVSWSGG